MCVAGKVNLRPGCYCGGMIICGLPKFRDIRPGDGAVASVAFTYDRQRPNELV